MMRAWTLSELEAPLDAQLLGVDATVVGVSTDSRSIVAGELFVALHGENFDGHKYLEHVRQAEAAGALVSANFASTLPQLKVEDTQRALGLLGAYNRNSFSGKLVAITGSGGKTTAKNLVAALLAKKGCTLATEGNLNNEIGVPLTLLKLAPEHQFAVVEMGAARAGDIKWLVTLGRPSVAVLLNAMPAHLESFGSVEDVALAKAEIFDQLQPGDTAIFNADQVFAPQWRERAGEASILDFGILQSTAAVRAVNIQTRGFSGVSFTAVTPKGELVVNLQLPGIHNVSNALAAIAVGLACEVSLNDIEAGLSSVPAVSGRLAVVETHSGATLIDDCYNAQPGSVKAAIDLLAQSKGRRTLVLGAMKELGPGSEPLHIEVAEYARDAGIEQMWGVGTELLSAIQAFGHGGRYFSSRETAAKNVSGAFNKEDTVLVKGSRSARMELVLAAISSANPVGGH
ncbi:MAG: UDP-N-acetylmuramoyl-tripeptide--D-alanyl-D-alanine ligase [Halioglobus sp.]|jgi:UDP-N-acetylmuramoyl-tripeptide--D-alanyl-D-alanine ligase